MFTIMETRLETCPRCDGDGLVAGEKIDHNVAKLTTCPKCEGRGKIEVEAPSSYWNPELKKNGEPN
jgi:DnaJ-class molecular chaperone